MIESSDILSFMRNIYLFIVSLYLILSIVLQLILFCAFTVNFLLFFRL